MHKLTFRILLSLALVMAASNCGKYLKHKDHPNGVIAPEGNALGLSVTEADYSKSKYCGDVRPNIPEDPTPPYTFDSKFIGDKLASADGLVGWIHGAVPRYNEYIFTYRKQDPDDFMAFFKAEQFSMIGATPEIWKTFSTLHRHDKVRLKGSFFKNASPLKHLMITEISVLKAYDKPTDNTYSFDVAKLKGATKFRVFGQIHAVVSSPELGYAVILEKDNFIMPIAVQKKHSEVAKLLYKGDIVDIDVEVVPGKEGRPPHFQTDGDSVTGVKIVDPLINCHGSQRTVEGHLVKFDKSPAINTDVYAVRIVDGNGIGRNFTFFPDVAADDDAFGEIFKAISAKAKKAWAEAEEAPGVQRNSYEKKTVHVVAHGKLNVVSTEQANAQVYLKSADDIEFTVVKEPAKAPGQ
jgi:hypothetical protein